MGRVDVTRQKRFHKRCHTQGAAQERTGPGRRKQHKAQGCKALFTNAAVPNPPAGLTLRPGGTTAAARRQRPPRRRRRRLLPPRARSAAAAFAGSGSPCCLLLHKID